MAMPAVPDTMRAASETVASWRFIIFFVIYAFCAMPKAEITKPRNTKRESAVSSGRRKNMAMSGAQKKRTAYIVRLARMLNQNTEL